MAAPDLSLPRPIGPLDRVLSLFSAVRAGEGVSALLLAANVFLLLGAYYILKTVREALILSEAGAEVASYSAAGQALLFLVIVPAYGAFASKVDRIRLISWVTLFFISHLGIFFLFGNAGFHVGIAYYLWLGVFNYLIVAQFWAFANDIYTEEQGKRLFPIVGVGASLGALVGARIASKIFAFYSPYQLMLISAVVLLGCIVLSLVVHRREAGRAGEVRARLADKPLGKEGGFHLVMKDRYLRLIAVMVLLLNLVNTTGQFLLNKLVVLNADRMIASGELLADRKGAFIGQFMGDFFSWVNLFGLLIQMFLVSRVFKYIGVRGALFVLPCIALGGYGLLVALPILGVVRIAKILENSTDYSLQNTTRHALFLPTSREAKYKAKAATDTFFVRFGDMIQAGVVFAGTQLGFGITNFATVNIIFVGVWLGISMLIFREHKRMTTQA